MPPRKLPRTSAEEEQRRPGRAMPWDLLLEIVARADAETIIRCAACCKALRRDILSPRFIRRLCNVPGARGCLLGFLHAYDKAALETRPPAPFTLAHPATSALTAFTEEQLSRPLSHGAGADLLGQYVPLTSRRGLVVLRSRHVSRRGTTDLCVFDPMSGTRVFFPYPPDIKDVSPHMYVPLTAAEGVGCSSFLLLAADFINHGETCCTKVHTVSADAVDRKWRPVAMANLPRRQPWSSVHYREPCCGTVVLSTLIHWLMYGDRCSMILTYDFNMRTAGSIELPPEGLLPDGCDMSTLLLTSSPDDGKLRLLVSDRLAVSIWRQLPNTGGGSWERQAVINVAPTLTSMVRVVPDMVIPLHGSGARSGTVLLRATRMGLFVDMFIVLHLETKEMRMVMVMKNHGRNISFPCEIDLMSRLTGMKSLC